MNEATADDGDDIHTSIWGKSAEEVVYTDEICSICGSRVDEFGFCACGAGGN